MSFKRLNWSMLGVAGVLEVALIASGVNQLGIDPTGSVVIRFYGNIDEVVGWLVLAILAGVAGFAVSTKDYRVLATIASGSIVVGSLFEDVLPKTQAQDWPWWAGLAFLGMGLAVSAVDVEAALKKVISALIPSRPA